MSTYLDLETDRYYDEENGRDRHEWTTIKLDRSYVSIAREHTDWKGVRRVDPEAGICFQTKHLNAVIDALVRLRANLPGQPLADATVPVIHGRYELEQHDRRVRGDMIAELERDLIEHRSGERDEVVERFIEKYKRTPQGKDTP